MDGDPYFLGAKGGAPTPFVNNFDSPAIGSLRYNTSWMGLPLPVLYGTQRLSINLLEFWGYGGGPGKGGKGGGGGKGTGKKQANYHVYVAAALCEGPVAGAGSVYVNAGISPGGPGSVGLNFYAGADGQAADPVFAAQDPNRPVLNYSGTCYVTGTPLQLGSSPSMPNFSVEVHGFQIGGVADYTSDANPRDIVVDFMTNPRYGAGFPGGYIDQASADDFANYCNTMPLSMSLLIDRCQPAARWLEEVMQLTVSAVFFSSGRLRMVPYLLTPASRNSGAGPLNWVPNLTVIYSVADADFVDFGGESDPVITTRSDPAMATNWFGIEYNDQSNYYNPNIAYQFDQGAIDQFGLRNEPTSAAPEFISSIPANTSAQLQLQRKQLIRNKYKFQLNATFALLEPMDVIELTDPGAGLNQTPVRIISIEENDNGELTFEAEEMPGIPSTPPLLVRSVPLSQTPNVFVDPGMANTPLIFEPPQELTGAINEVWIVASSSSPTWGGANVWASTDGTTYTFVGQVFDGPRLGKLTATLASYGGANPDGTHTLSVDINESDLTHLPPLMSASPADAANYVTLCYVDGELISYETATLTAAGKYDLTTLYRGIYGTPINSHGIGSQFAYLGLQTDVIGVLKYNYPPNLVGQTIYIKLQSFNIFLGETQDISTVPVFTYTLNGRGAVVPNNIPFSFNGIPQNGVPIVNYTFGEPFNFQTNFSGSFCTAGTAASLITSFDLAKNGGAPFGTMSFAALAASATFSGTATDFIAGDILTITPTRTDATLANLTGNLAGQS